MSKRPFAAIIRWALISVTPTLLICALARCSQSNDPNAWYNKTMVENLGGHTTPAPDAPDQPVAPGGPEYAVAAAPGVAPPGGPGIAPPGGPLPASGPVPPGELYWSETSCGALPPPPPTGFATPTDISLQMTECDVARRSGRPDKVELSAAPNGVRGLTLSYLRGPQPHVYHFVAGRLVSIEYLIPPPPAGPPRKQRPRQARAM